MLKKLMGSIRQFKAASILSPVCVTLEVALECIIPLYMVEMLEKIQIDNSIKTILLYGGVLLALAAFSQANLPLPRPQDLREIFAKICITAYRDLPFPI